MQNDDNNINVLLSFMLSYINAFRYVHNTTVLVVRQKMMETLQDSIPFISMSILFLLVSMKIEEIDNSSV